MYDKPLTSSLIDKDSLKLQFHHQQAQETNAAQLNLLNHSGCGGSTSGIRSMRKGPRNEKNL